MASRDDTSCPRRSVCSQNASAPGENPLVALRHRADDFMSAALDDIRHLLSPELSRVQAQSMSRSRDVEDASWGIPQWPPRHYVENRDQKPDPVSASDASSSAPSPWNAPRDAHIPFDTDSGLRSQPVSFFGLHASPLLWWLRFSPYSPTNLENDPYLQAMGAHWRRAFDDLMASSQQQQLRGAGGDDDHPNQQPLQRGLLPLSDSSVAQRIEAERETETLSPALWEERCLRRWMSRHRQWKLNDANAEEETKKGTETREYHYPAEPSWLLERLIRAASQLGAEAEADSHKTTRQALEAVDDDADEDEDEDGHEYEGPATELDAYEELLEAQTGSSGTQRWQSSRSAGSEITGSSTTKIPSSDDVPSSPLVSTLTKTERVVLPDGTVRTRMVLRKRFADGREEETESVHTGQPAGRTQHETFGRDGDGGILDMFSSPQENRAGLVAKVKALSNAQKLESEARDSNPKGDTKDTQPNERKRGGWFWS